MHAADASGLTRVQEEAARLAAEAAARASYGRLVAFMTARTRDVAAAEDALAEAFRSALEVWPVRGVPDRPEAWLLAVARRSHGHRHRHAGVQRAAVPTLELLAEEAQDAMDADRFPDERLKLLFVCAHPAIDEASRAPLMLQTVMGLDAVRIAAAFLVAPAAMGQRLVRAKAKIRDAGIAFAVPGPDELAERLSPVLDAIYAAYGTGWEDVSGADTRIKGLAEEAAWLARLTVALVPDEPEARGLHALILHGEARRAARRSNSGVYVPLSEQDPRRWNGAMIKEAEAVLYEASRLGRPGPYQLEAAIQSVHAMRARTGKTEWDALVTLYDALAQMRPSIGVAVARAAAIGEARGAASGLAALTDLPPERIATYQPAWAVRADLLARLGRLEEARAAYDRSIALADDPAVRAFLLLRQDRA